MLQKLKSFLADDAFYYSAVIILVAGASFGLGRQSVVEKTQENSLIKQNSVILTPAAQSAPTPTLNPTISVPVPVTSQGAAAVGVVSGEVVASKSGSKYHLPTCPGAKQIKPDNLISFETIAAAEAAGYTPAANCKF
jgi:Metal binding domain of Ada